MAALTVTALGRPLLGLVPLAAFLALMLGGGLLFVLLQSLGFAPWHGINSFPDLGYYQTLIERPAFWASFGLTIYYAAVATVLSAILGTALALSLRAVALKSSVVQRLLELTLVVPYGVGIALAVLMMGNGGVISRAVAGLGLIDQPSEFPRLIQSHAGYGIIAVFLWKQIPFVAVSVLAVLARRGRDIEDAAQVLGANRSQVLTDIVLPTIAPALLSAALIGFAFNVGAFEVPLILGGGHPRTLPVLAWELMADSDLARRLEAMAIIVLMAGIVAIAAVGSFWLSNRFAKTGGRHD